MYINQIPGYTRIEELQKIALLGSVHILRSNKTVGKKWRDQQALGTYINQIPGCIRVEELQKIALLGSAHILRRTLSIT